MKSEQLKKEQSKWRIQRNFLVLLSSLLTLSLLFQTVFLFGKKERVVLIPPFLEESFWVENSTVSPAYLEQSALFLAGQLFSKTPQSAARQRNTVLKQSSIAFARVLSQKLLEEEERLLKQNITYMYYFDACEIIKPLELVIRGQRLGFVNEERVFSKKEAYRFSFVIEGMRLLLDSVEMLDNE